MVALDRLGQKWQPLTLSVLRIFAGLLFLQFGCAKILGWPSWANGQPAAFTLIWFAGMIELVAGVLLTLGLFTRMTAFICSGQMAFAYFIGHFGKSVLPIQNGGTLAVLFCFVFFYLASAGAGPLSLDAKRMTSPVT